MQVELKSLQRQFNITFIYVTHDQQEALSMSDRIAVLNEGKIEQIGTPSEIYSSPNSSFVANFVGTSNIFDKSIAKEIFNIDSAFSIRPEKIRISHKKPDQTNNCVYGEIEDYAYMGNMSVYRVKLETGIEVRVTQPNMVRDTAERLTWGDKVYLFWGDDCSVVLTA